ncbi:MAG: Asp-tRNA(Asn)/Glu-tRNA(Gln) amidotransferase subunit GatA [Parcubacteria group bacterium]|nr:Asp-tRNA(Asn)/Glu-tRNA(Gln) amidotransferase subunit GatA [Parcubacteria group bacterium]
MDLANLSIKQIHDGFMKKKFSCAELTQAFLNRIKELNPKIQAYITITDREALEAAKKVDAKLAQGESIHVLEGVPVSIKDNLATKGVLTTAGSNILKNYVASYDAAAVKRLKDAGCILLGKTNCDAFGHGSSTENSDFFSTKNPWDLSRVPGGSSGGSAASVSTDLAVYSLGTDTGGSVRSPANYCGVAGLKPSYGRISRYGLLSMTSSTDCIGIFAKTIEDIAYALTQMAGEDLKDATSRKSPAPDYAKSLGQDNLKGVRIGVPKEYFGQGLSSNIRETIEKTLKTMERLGAKLVEVSLPHSPYAVAVYYVVTPSEISSNLARYDGIKYGYSAGQDSAKGDPPSDLYEVYTKSRKYGFGREAKRRIMIGTYALSSGYYDAYYKKASAIRHLIADDFRDAFGKVDIIATPVSPNLPFKLGEKVSDPLALYLEDIYLSAVSLAGLPALSLPCGFANPMDNPSQKLPVGIQLIGKYMEEESLLMAAHVYEQKMEWYKARPKF